jgi:hypothetical protein
MRHSGLVNWFIWTSLVVATISSYTLKITIAHVMPHSKSSNSSSGHAAALLELQNLSEVNSRSCILSYYVGMDHTQKTQFSCCISQTTQKTSHVITISLVHWCIDCRLATSYKHSSYCFVHVSWGVYWAITWQCIDMSQYYVWHSITNTLYPFNYWYDSLVYKKKPVPNSWFSFSFP